MSARRTAAAAGILAVVLALALALVATGCANRKTSRELQSPAPDSSLPRAIAATTLIPGGSASPAIAAPNPLEGNTYAISEGQRLFGWYNCAGCHFRGGGGIGPALMDAKWLYGGAPSQIYRTIVEGAPNGMPAWGGRIPEQQIWQIVAYVQSLDADKKLAQAPGPRSDHLQAGEGKKSR